VIALSYKWTWIMRRIRGLRLAWRIRLGGGKVGKKLMAERHIRFRYPPHRGWTLGNSVYLGTGVIVDASGTLTVGDYCRVSPYTVIASLGSVTLGSHVQVGECSSIRDSNHEVDAPLMWGSAKVDPIVIGNDVWVGRGVAVLAGVTVGDGAVLGANAVVNRDIEARGVAVGVPARVVKTR
jgi:serine acetyltransferase